MRARSRVSWLAVLVASPLALSATSGFAQSPEYQEPPSGYQQTPPQPGDAQPGYAQPGYAQPGYGQPGAYPPPGYYPPGQPGYGAPPPYQGPGYFPPAEPPAPTVPGYARGFLAMPYLGMNIPVGHSGDHYSPGFRLGAILGGNVMRELSLNGELAFDVMNPKDVPSSADVSAVFFDFTFSPLVHLGNDAIQFFAGPKLGLFGFAATVSGSGQSTDSSAFGLAYGANFGVAIPVGNIAFAGLLSYTGRHATETCYTLPGRSETCNTSPSEDDFKQMTFTGALMF